MTNTLLNHFWHLSRCAIRYVMPPCITAEQRDFFYFKITTPIVRHRIKYHRGNQGISIPQMAELLNMNERNYYRIESGEKKSIELELLYRISEVLHIPIEELIQGDQIIVGNITNGIGVNIGSESVTIGPNNTDLNPELKELIQSLHSIIEEQQKLLNQQVEIIKNAIKNKT